MSIIKKIKDKVQDISEERRKDSIRKTSNFAKANRNCIVFVLDKNSDDMVAAYRDKYMAARMMTKFLGVKRKKGLVKSILLEKKRTRKKDANIMAFEKFMTEFLWQISEKLEDREQNIKDEKDKEKRSVEDNKIKEK